MWEQFHMEHFLSYKEHFHFCLEHFQSYSDHLRSYIEHFYFYREDFRCHTEHCHFKRCISFLTCMELFNCLHSSSHVSLPLPCMLLPSCSLYPSSFLFIPLSPSWLSPASHPEQHIFLPLYVSLPLFASACLPLPLTATLSDTDTHART